MNALTTTALSFLYVISFASIGECRAPVFQARAVSACSAQCLISSRRLLCPVFLVTPEHYPCSDYKMEQTACGWQLKRVFMCR
jgi:hypothetical protein